MNKKKLITLGQSSLKRCAVYTRVSNDDRLNQEFNSIDAQREAGLAYIASQRHEGWLQVENRYEDGGFSGGTLERPALKRLMEDIRVGLIDVVIVYKIDRLTRSLLDFTHLIELFDQQQISLVSVTQSFNTTTSMGRLTLNMMLSFAQFEREITGERIRDKIRASKQKGLWMGGVPPLGYDIKNRQLVVNEWEAEIVLQVFEQMSMMGSVTLIVAKLKEAGVTTKCWYTQNGKKRGGQPIDKKYVYALLKNRLYLGEMSHHGQWFPAVHRPIIRQALWNAVQTQLQDTELDSHRQEMPTLLNGLLFASNGERMYSTYTRKANGKTYYYYITKSTQRFGQKAKRFPALDLEEAVLTQVKLALCSPEVLTAVLQQSQHEQLDFDEAQITLALKQFTPVWTNLFLEEQRQLLGSMIERIDVVGDPVQGLKIQWHALNWRTLLENFLPHSLGHELCEDGQ